jgi:hypothetical protein
MNDPPFLEQPSENDLDMVNSLVMASADDKTREEISASNRNADIHQPRNPTKEKDDRTARDCFKCFDEIYN